MTQTAVKYDQGKPRPSLLPAQALLAVSDVSAYGAKKYGDGNIYQGGLSIGRLEDAMLRHYYAYKSGEAHDTESGLPHLSHMAWNALFILHFALQVENEKT